MGISKISSSKMARSKLTNPITGLSANSSNHSSTRRQAAARHERDDMELDEHAVKGADAGDAERMPSARSARVA